MVIRILEWAGMLALLVAMALGFWFLTEADRPVEFLVAACVAYSPVVVVVWWFERLTR